MPEQYDLARNKKTTQKLRALQQKLPAFCGDFFRGIENNTSVLTRYGYAVDLLGFFGYIATLDGFPAAPLPSWPLSCLDEIRPVHIEMYLEHVTLYTKQGKEYTNREHAKSRKLSAVRSLYKYFYKKERIRNNPAALVDVPKLHEKAIVRLEADEVATLLDGAEAGMGLTAAQRRFHGKTARRDVAILTLFLSSGIRISELVGINIRDVNFSTDEFVITRKGGNQDTLILTQEARGALLDYLVVREQLQPVEGHEAAFFLSLQRRRITPRAVENLVKKYARAMVPLKKISPHKLRSTYGTMLYRETGDIYLVADVLGHKDVNTTKKHYAAISEDSRRAAAKAVVLRDDPPSS